MSQIIKHELNEASFKRLINDIDFDRLELWLKNPNIFRILKISKTEIRHSNFLAWLLDPLESHNLREVFLKRFLNEISIDLEISGIDGIEVRREWRNIDLLVLTSEFAICIENKVESTEHSDQLLRYKNIVRENFPDKKLIFVYLTTYRLDPSDDDYKSFSYDQIVGILERVIELYGRTIISDVKLYLQNYIETLKLEIMANHEYNKLAIQLYNRHKDTFDFIFANKPDNATFFSTFFKAAIEDAGWIISSDNKGVFRFLTPKLKSVLPEMNGGWSQKDSFGFDLDYYWYNQKQVVFKTVISPGEGTPRDEKIREILLNAVRSVEGSQEPKGKKWLVPIIKKDSFVLDKMAENDEDFIRGEISKIFKKITEIVNKVEDSILLRSEELKSLIPVIDK
jgi:hypothetical protein